MIVRLYCWYCSNLGMFAGRLSLGWYPMELPTTCLAKNKFPDSMFGVLPKVLSLGCSYIGIGSDWGLRESLLGSVRTIEC